MTTARPVCALFFLSILTSESPAHAAFFNLTGDVSAIDEAPSGTLVVDGITATLTANTGILNSTGENFGVNGPALGTADESDEIDAPANGAVGESVTITFDQDVTFMSFEVDAFAADGSTVARYNLPAPPATTGTVSAASVVTLNVLLPAGSPAVFSSDFGSYSLDSFTVTAIPEPTSLALLSVGGLLLVGARRR